MRVSLGCLENRYSKVYRYMCLFCLMACLAVPGGRAQVSPLDYGLREASNGIERYRALYNAHADALKRGLEVDYDGIDTLYLEIPDDFKTIPLGPYTDFRGLVLYVDNHARHCTLFSKSSAQKAVSVDKAVIDKLDFLDIPELAQGSHLLVLEDLTPWTERRGYGYQQFRRDILVVRDGLALNAPVTAWNTDSTRVKAYCYDFEPEVKPVVKNLTMHRVKGCTFRTNCLSLVGQYGVTVSNVHVTTPRSKMIADGIFGVTNCAGIVFVSDTVEGTYSGYGASRNYGYAFSMNNVYDARFLKIKAYGNWGVFGSNNMSNTCLEYCDIDRFDVHCYGRNISLKHCTLKGRQTIFSSIYGTVAFDSCEFIDYTPIRIRSSYNAYTPFDVVMTDCSFRLTRRYHSLIQVDMLDTADNPRPELNPKSWPNLKVENLTVIAPPALHTMYVFNPKGTAKELRRDFGYIDTVELDGLRCVRPSGRRARLSVKLSSRDFRTTKQLNYKLKFKDN